MKPGKDYIGVGVGAFIVNDKEELLLVLRGENCKNEAGLWSIPGGSVEYGETIQEAVKREIKEELGVDIEPIRVLSVVNHIIPDDDQHWVSPDVLCKIVSGEPKNMEPHKHDDMQWFPLDKLPENINMCAVQGVEAYQSEK